MQSWRKRVEILASWGVDEEKVTEKHRNVAATPPMDSLLALARNEKVDAEVRHAAYKSLKALVGVATD